MSKKIELGIGVDCGTMNLVSARRTSEGTVETSRMRNAFLDLEVGAKKMLKLSGVNFIDQGEDGIVVIGDAALEMANVFGREARRPLSRGLVSAGEMDALKVLGVLIKGVLGEPKTPGEICYFSVPASPLDESRDVVYHKGILERIINECGFDAIAGNEALAIIFAETAKENFSGIGLSFGSGMTNCLSGETLIPLLDGSKKSLKELAENYSDKEFWVYSSTESGQIVPGKAHHPRRTGTSEVIRIHLDNGSYLEATGDHLFMNRDGSYTKAKDLVVGTSLMPLYLRQEKEGPGARYIQVRNNAGKRWNWVHRIVAAHCLGRPLHSRRNSISGKDEIVHHKNFRGSDNTPENLQVMTRSDHAMLHEAHAKAAKERMYGKSYEEIYGAERAREIRIKIALGQSDPEVFAKMLEGSERGREAIRKNRTDRTFEEIFGEEKASDIKALLSKAKKGIPLAERLGEDKAAALCAHWSESRKGIAGKYERTESIKEKISQGLKEYFLENPHPIHVVEEEARRKISDSLKAYFSENPRPANSPETRKKISEALRGKPKGPPSPETIQKRKDTRKARLLREAQEPNNHKVVLVESTGKIIDVYDLTVEEFHNFGTDAGVFVHNCVLAINGVEGMAFSCARGGDWIDAGAAKAVGSTASRVCASKEKGFDLLNPQNREQEALALYYKSLIEYVLDQIVREFDRNRDRFSLPKPIPIIVSGGTSMAGNFLEFFKQVFDKKKKKFPIEITEIRAASDPMNAVARGLLIQALNEYSE